MALSQPCPWRVLSMFSHLLYAWQRDQQDGDPVYPCVSCLFRYLGPLTTWSLNLLAEIDLIGSLWE